METLEEFDKECPLTATFCQLISTEEFEEQSIAYTEQALRELYKSMDQTPRLYERVIRKRKQRELEKASIASFIEAKFFSTVQGDLNRCNAMGTAELKRRVEQLKEEMQKVSSYSREAKCMRTSMSERLDSGHSTRKIMPQSCGSTTALVHHPLSLLSCIPSPLTPPCIPEPPTSSLPPVTPQSFPAHLTSNTLCVTPSSLHPPIPDSLVPIPPIPDALVPVPPITKPSAVTPSSVPASSSLIPSVAPAQSHPALKDHMFVPTVVPSHQPPVNALCDPRFPSSLPLTSYFVSTLPHASPSSVPGPALKSSVPSCLFPSTTTHSSQPPSGSPLFISSLSANFVTPIVTPFDSSHMSSFIIPASPPSHPDTAIPPSILGPQSNHPDSLTSSIVPATLTIVPVTASSVPAPPASCPDRVTLSSIPKASHSHTDLGTHFSICALPVSHLDSVIPSSIPHPPSTYSGTMTPPIAPVPPPDHPDPVNPSSARAPPFSCPNPPTPSSVSAPSHPHPDPSGICGRSSSHTDPETFSSIAPPSVPHTDPITSSVPAPSSVLVTSCSAFTNQSSQLNPKTPPCGPTCPSSQPNTVVLSCVPTLPCSSADPVPASIVSQAPSTRTNPVPPSVAPALCISNPGLLVPTVNESLPSPNSEIPSSLVPPLPAGIPVPSLCTRPSSTSLEIPSSIPTSLSSHPDQVTTTPPPINLDTEMQLISPPPPPPSPSNQVHQMQPSSRSDTVPPSPVCVPPPAPPLPPLRPHLFFTPHREQINSCKTPGPATPDLLIKNGLGKPNSKSLLDPCPDTSLFNGSIDNLSSLQAELQAGNHINRLRSTSIVSLLDQSPDTSLVNCSRNSLSSLQSELQAGNHTNRLRSTGIVRSPGGTPMVDSSSTTTPSLSFNTSLLAKFQNVNSPETSDSDNSGFETPSGTPTGTP
ncbi:uncharacterized protein LOC144792572 isoform X2 [Lissotriton helveticus]